jgi:hypothetical protein
MPDKSPVEEFDLEDDNVSIDEQGRVIIDNPQLAEYVRASKEEKEGAAKPAYGVYFRCSF